MRRGQQAQCSCMPVVKAFDTVGVDTLHKQTVLNFFTFLVKIISSHLHPLAIQTQFQAITSTCRGMLSRMCQVGLVYPFLFRPCVHDMHTLSRQAQLALYADDTAILVIFRQPTLHVSDLEHWLRDWWIANKHHLLEEYARCNQKPLPVHLSGEPIQWVDIARYLRIAPEKHLTQSTVVNRLGKKKAQTMASPGPLLNMTTGLS